MGCLQPVPGNEEPRAHKSCEKLIEVREGTGAISEIPVRRGMVAEKDKTNQVAERSYAGLLTGVVDLLQQARRTSARSVNAIITATYWEIGRRIVEHEQRGKSSSLRNRTGAEAGLGVARSPYWSAGQSSCY